MLLLDKYTKQNQKEHIMRHQKRSRPPRRLVKLQESSTEMQQWPAWAKIDGNVVSATFTGEYKNARGIFRINGEERSLFIAEVENEELLENGEAVIFAPQETRNQRKKPVRIIDSGSIQLAPGPRILDITSVDLWEETNNGYAIWNSTEEQWELSGTVEHLALTVDSGAGTPMEEVMGGETVTKVQFTISFNFTGQRELDVFMDGYPDSNTSGGATLHEIFASGVTSATEETFSVDVPDYLFVEEDSDYWLEFWIGRDVQDSGDEITLHKLEVFVKD